LEGTANLVGEAIIMHMPIIEPIAVPDVYVSGVLPKEELGGGLVRVTAYAIQRGPDGTQCAVIVSRHVVCEADMMRNIASLMLDVSTPERALVSAH
jgi:hypothetical protein